MATDRTKRTIGFRKEAEAARGESRAAPRGFTERLLNRIERWGNRLPDPVLLFIWALLATWVVSWLLAAVDFDAIDPRSGLPLQVHNQVSGAALAAFLAGMVDTFVRFPPLGLVLVALLGVGVAERVGFLPALLRALLRLTPQRFLTPMVLLVAIVSHTAADAGYVLVVPLGGVIFHAAGRHPLAGIAVAFAGVSGGFSANFIPSGIDPLLQGFTQSAARIIAAEREVSPLGNWWFTSASSVLVVLLGWFVCERIVEPRLRAVPVDATVEPAAGLAPLQVQERRGLWLGLGTMAVLLLALVVAAWPLDSPLRAEGGELAVFAAPLMQSIVPLIFLLFLLPSIAYGIAAGTVRSHRDVVAGMAASMNTMGYYIVLAFFAALFTESFKQSNLGALLALKGASLLVALSVPAAVTVTAVVTLTAGVNLVIGSASAKWALLSPILVPMLMQAGISPELTQAAYRVGDSATNIITPLMPYFPLVVVYCQRYVARAGVGTLVSLMLPYSVTFFVGWTLFLLLYWATGLPLGLQATYTYP